VAGECSNAMEAYNLMQSQHIDVLLLDIEMPDMTGLELTRHLGNKNLSLFSPHPKRNTQWMRLN